MSPGTKPSPASRGCCDPEVPELPPKWHRKWVGSAAVSDLPLQILLPRLEFCFSCQTLSDASINPPVPWMQGPQGRTALQPHSLKHAFTIKTRAPLHARGAEGREGRSPKRRGGHCGGLTLLGSRWTDGPGHREGRMPEQEWPGL